MSARFFYGNLVQLLLVVHTSLLFEVSDKEFASLERGPNFRKPCLSAYLGQVWDVRLGG